MEARHMRDGLGFTLILIFMALALLHLYWALGGQSGRAASIPSVKGKKLFNPSAGMTFAVAAALLIAGAVIDGSLGWFDDAVPPVSSVH
jgi:hypothetical protein